MNQLSGYAKKTRTYGWAFGNSNVESIAELNAAYGSGVLDQMNLSAADKALVMKLLTWIRRPAQTPPQATPAP